MRFFGRSDGSAQARPPMVEESPRRVPAATAPRTFDDIYAAHFADVWRSLIRLGVPPANLDDAAQDVFIVVHRRLAEFEGRSSLTTWLYGICLRVAKDHRRRDSRKGGLEPLTPTLTAGLADAGPGPQQATETAEAFHALRTILETLPDEQREVFVLAELEQLTAPEMAEILGIKLNTVYSRLRTARQSFEKALAAVPGRLP